MMKQLSQASPLACDCRANCSGWRALPFWNKTERNGQRKQVSFSKGARFISSSNEEKKGWLERRGGSENNRSQALVFCFLCDNKGHMIYYTALQSAGQRSLLALPHLWLYSAHNHTITARKGIRTWCCFPSIRLLPWTQQFNQALW